MFKKIRQRLHFYGRVQGVGFRYRARVAAGNAGVTGFVRNEYDDSVLMEVQGTYPQISDMMSELFDSPYIRISNVEKENLPVLEDEKGFRVQHI